MMKSVAKLLCCLLLLFLLCPTTALAWTWTAVPVGKAPRVSGHVAATDAKKDRVIVFGGLTGNAGSPCTDQLWTFSDNKEWSLVKNSGSSGPGPRMYSAAAVLHDTLYLVGGWDPGAPKSGGTFLDEIWTLDLTAENLEWKKEESNTLPCGPVSRHAACTVGDDTLVVHTFRGVVVLTSDGEWKEQETSGEAPEGLSMCAMSPLTDTSLLVFGGSTQTQQLSADAFVLDTKTWEWTKLDCSSAGPSPRASPSAAHIGDNQCVIFGGASLGDGGYQGGAGLQAQGDAWVLTVDGSKCVWEKIETSNGPKPRLAASLCSASSDSGLLLQGGWDPAGETFEDTWILQ
ncbi:only protein 42 [Seminavis robusta]|uniref:Only protein 42 n=1 Tax=Seminavis robusta TaxID=568900 RepID=A0A9N8HA67_9STRA|nr:only protein 42 [Seminavis robusta]|eukprot:Sro214_g088810.1 only protein 42 (344) ;mRNA; f:65220-66251